MYGKSGGKKEVHYHDHLHPENGVENGSLAVSGGSFATVLAALTGTGTGGTAGPFSFSPPSTSFSNTLVGGTSSKTLTVTNTSGSVVTINFAASSDFGVVGSGTNPCFGSLNPSTSCTVTLSFKPSVPGSLIGEVTFMFGASGTQIYDMKGMGVLPVTFTPASLTLAQTVGQSISKTVTINNNQAVTLNFTAAFAASGQYSVTPGGPTPCAGSVAPHGKCTVMVTFTPTKKGAIPGAVTVTHDANGSPQAIKLSGTGQ